jgi:hypothetical protein
MRTEACASHLGVMVVAMTTWARKQDLTNADLYILIIEQPPRESYPKQPRHRRRAQTSGLVFSTIHLGTQESLGVDTCPAACDTYHQVP